MSSGLFPLDKGSGFTVCCFRFSVEGWETAQTELGPPIWGFRDSELAATSAGEEDEEPWAGRPR